MEGGFGFLRVDEMSAEFAKRNLPYNNEGGIERLLGEQLSEATAILAEHHKRATRVVEDNMGRLKVDLMELRSENQQLRQRLQSAGLSLSVPSWYGMGGTGESSSSESKPRHPNHPENALESSQRPAPPSMQRSGRTPEHSAPPIMSLPGSTEVEIVERQMEQNRGSGLSGHQSRPVVQSSAGASDRVESFRDAEFKSVLPKPTSNEPLPITDMTMMDTLDSEVEQDVNRPAKVNSHDHHESARNTEETNLSGMEEDDLYNDATPSKRDPKPFRGSIVQPHAVDPSTQGGPKAVFADAAAMKEKLRAALHEEEYNVTNFYHDKGFWQKVARNSWFDNFTLLVIFANAIWIWIDTDYNDSEVLLEADLGFFVGENAFCVYFAFEWIVRFMAFKKKRNGLKDAWFVFDSSLVFMMVMETWVLTLIIAMTSSSNTGFGGNASILRLLRLLRLTRMARMARLLRALPELMILVKGIAVATRSVLFTLLLLMLIIYVFAIAFTSLTKGTELGDKYFKRVPMAMDTLLLGGTLPDHQDIVDEVGAEHVLLKILFLIFMLLASLTVMNMLMGVLVEVVSVVSAVEKEQMVVNFVKHQLQSLLHTSGLDADGDNQISKAEFENLLEKQEAARALQDVGVDVVGLVDFTDFIFKDDIELSFPDFMEMVLQLRGSNTATVKDIVDFRKFVHAEFDRLENKIAGRIVEGFKNNSVANVLMDGPEAVSTLSKTKKGAKQN
mmetsp:Transcript_109754/g.199844  ORF Transcript_109754/g.199844 Transcript_109754/m.199844 type:complete len:728 (-) Transcript_109754:68-2251(-)